MQITYQKAILVLNHWHSAQQHSYCVELKFARHEKGRMYFVFYDGIVPICGTRKDTFYGNGLINIKVIKRLNKNSVTMLSIGVSVLQVFAFVCIKM